MNSPDPLHIIFGVAGVIAFWIAANQFVEMCRRWAHWRVLLRSHHARRAAGGSRSQPSRWDERIRSRSRT